MDSLAPAYLFWFFAFLFAFVVASGIMGAVVLIANRQGGKLNEPQQKVAGVLAYSALALVAITAVGTVVSAFTA